MPFLITVLLISPSESFFWAPHASKLLAVWAMIDSKIIMLLPVTKRVDNMLSTLLSH